MLVEIDIHSYAVLIPNAGIDVELSILKAVVIGHRTGIVGMIVPRLSPMACAVEIAVLHTAVDAVDVTELHNVGLAAFRPAHLVKVVAHHPECRPQAVGCLRQFYRRLHLSVGKRHLVFRVYTSRRELLAVVHLAHSRQNKAMVALAVITETHVALAVGVELQLVVAAAGTVHLNVPTVRTQLGVIKQILPHQPVSVGFAGAHLSVFSHCWKRCARSQRHEE